jgi:hypothetical protein
MTTIRWTDTAEDAYLAFLQAAYNHSTESAQQLERLLERPPAIQKALPTIGKNTRVSAMPHNFSHRVGV